MTCLRNPASGRFVIFLPVRPPSRFGCSDYGIEIVKTTIFLLTIPDSDFRTHPFSHLVASTYLMYLSKVVEIQ